MKKQAIQAEDFTRASQYKEQIAELDAANGIQRSGSGKFEAGDSVKLTVSSFSSRVEPSSSSRSGSSPITSRYRKGKRTACSFTQNETNVRTEKRRIRKVKHTPEIHLTGIWRSKKQYIQAEDYTKASYYKQQIELLESNYQRDLELFNNQNPGIKSSANLSGGYQVGGGSPAPTSSRDSTYAPPVAYTSYTSPVIGYQAPAGNTFMPTQNAYEPPAPVAGTAESMTRTFINLTRSNYVYSATYCFES